MAIRSRAWCQRVCSGSEAKVWRKRMVRVAWAFPRRACARFPSTNRRNQQCRAITSLCRINANRCPARSDVQLSARSNSTTLHQKLKRAFKDDQAILQPQEDQLSNDLSGC